ncbi:glycosyltransferase [Patescibacteria group bacterium]|nr:glycosyltransferase [Patescibacteria group bacterium]
MSISVVIPSRNVRNKLDKTLSNLMGQLREGDEVVVVDDDSSDGLRDMLEAKYSPPVEYVRLEDHKRWRLQAVRNAGIQASSNPIIYMLDADCVPQPECVDRLREQAGKGKYVSGILLYDVSRREQRRQAKKFKGMAASVIAIGDYPIDEIIRRIEDDSKEVRGTLGCNIMFHREDAEKVGFYDEEFDGKYGYDDTALLLALHFNGVKHVYPGNCKPLMRAIAYHQPQKVDKAVRVWRDRCLMENRALLREKLQRYREGKFTYE